MKSLRILQTPRSLRKLQKQRTHSQHACLRTLMAGEDSRWLHVKLLSRRNSITVNKLAMASQV